MLETVWRKRNPPTPWWGCKLVQALWKTVRRGLKKTKNRVTIWSSSLTPGYISRKNSNLKRYINSNVHRSTIYKSQDMEAIEMFINRWIDKEDVLHIYNAILPLSHKKWNNLICSNMDGRRDNHTKWSQSDKDLSYGITYMWTLKTW